MLIDVDSLDDPRLAGYRDLPRSATSGQPNRFIVEGRLLVERLVASRHAVESLLVDSRHLHMLPEQLPAETPVYVARPDLLDGIVGFDFHRGILARGVRGVHTTIDELSGPGDVSRLLVICVNVCDPVNLGGILRNAAAFGVDGVLISDDSADPWSRRVLRVSMGAALQLPIVVTGALQSDLRALQSAGIQLTAMVLDRDADLLDTALRPPKLALLVGNEGHGLPDDIATQCQQRLLLPMANTTDSLNAAVASGIFLYHFTRAAR